MINYWNKIEKNWNNNNNKDVFQTETTFNWYEKQKKKLLKNYETVQKVIDLRSI